MKMKLKLSPYMDSYPRMRHKRVAPGSRIRVAPGIQAHFDGKQSIVFTFKGGEIAVPFSGVKKAYRLFVQKNLQRFELRVSYKAVREQPRRQFGYIIDQKLNRQIEKAAGQKAVGSDVWKLRCLYFEFKTQVAVDRAVKRMSKLGVKTKVRDTGEWIH